MKRTALSDAIGRLIFNAELNGATLPNVMKAVEEQPDYNEGAENPLPFNFFVQANPDGGFIFTICQKNVGITRPMATVELNGEGQVIAHSEDHQ